jgi:hypothetical protein
VTPDTDPALRETFLEFLTVSKRPKPPIRTAVDLARRKEHIADLCERFLQPIINADLSDLLEALSPQDRPAAEQRLRNLAADWRATAMTNLDRRWQRSSQQP